MSNCQCPWHLAANRFCPVQNLDLSEATSRLKTFTIFNWPFKTQTSLLDFAEAGLYYTGESDIVKCFLCNVSMGGWEPGDSPSGEHKRINPTCRLVLGMRTFNTPIFASPFPALPDPIGDYDVVDC